MGLDGIEVIDDGRQPVKIMLVFADGSTEVHNRFIAASYEQDKGGKCHVFTHWAVDGMAAENLVIMREALLDSWNQAAHANIVIEPPDDPDEPEVTHGG